MDYVEAVLAAESSELVGDVEFGGSTEEMGDDAPDSVTVSGVVITVAALSFHQWNVSFGPLAQSMFRRMGGVKGMSELVNEGMAG
jgi:hypothetical protein